MSLARAVRPVFRTCAGVFAVSLIMIGLYAVANADESSNDVTRSVSYTHLTLPTIYSV